MDEKPKEIADLTPRNRVFLELLASGVDTLDAYKQAGYRGSPHAAYELKSSLKGPLAALLEAKGFSHEGVASEILNLVKLPLHESQTKVNIQQKIQILKLMLQALPKQEKEQKQLTNFIISQNSDGGLKIASSDVIDVTPEQPK